MTSDVSSSCTAPVRRRRGRGCPDRQRCARACRLHAVASSPSPKPAHPDKLSEYGLFVGNGSTQEPAEGVIPYDLNSPLFSDYTEKFRFVKLPAGKSAEYREDEIARISRRHDHRQDVRLSRPTPAIRSWAAASSRRAS